MLEIRGQFTLAPGEKCMQSLRKKTEDRCIPRVTSFFILRQLQPRTLCFGSNDNTLYVLTPDSKLKWKYIAKR